MASGNSKSKKPSASGNSDSKKPSGSSVNLPPRHDPVAPGLPLLYSFIDAAFSGSVSKKPPDKSKSKKSSESSVNLPPPHDLVAPAALPHSFGDAARLGSVSKKPPGKSESKKPSESSVNLPPPHDLVAPAALPHSFRDAARLGSVSKKPPGKSESKKPSGSSVDLPVAPPTFPPLSLRPRPTTPALPYSMASTFIDIVSKKPSGSPPSLLQMPSKSESKEPSGLPPRAPQKPACVRGVSGSVDVPYPMVFCLQYNRRKKCLTAHGLFADVAEDEHIPGSRFIPWTFFEKNDKNRSLRDDLKIWMPNVETTGTNEEFWKHEYDKHGFTLGLEPFQYFDFVRRMCEWMSGTHIGFRKLTFGLEPNTEYDADEVSKIFYKRVGVYPEIICEPYKFDQCRIKEVKFVLGPSGNLMDSVNRFVSVRGKVNFEWRKEE